MRRLVALALVAWPALAGAVGEQIIAVDVVGNAKTNDETVRDIAHVEAGDKLVDGLVERVTIDLQSSGLFKEVAVTVEPVSPARVRMRIKAADKHSWVIAPTFYTQPGNIGGGAGFGENNLFGRNKKVLLYAQVATADTFFLGGYLDPAIGGSRFYWRLDTILRHSKVTEFDSPQMYLGQPEPLRITTMNFLNGGLLLGMNLWRGWSIDGRLRGAYVTYSDARYDDNADVTGLPMDPVLPEVDGWDVSTEWKITRDKRANWNGVTSGNVVQVSYEHSLPDLGSNWNYWSAKARVGLYKRLFTNHNLILRASGAIGWRLPFQQEVTSGGTGLRGYKNQQFRGDSKAAATLEYSAHLFWIKSLAFRTVAFYDTAWTTFLMNEGNPTRNYLPGQTAEMVNRWRNGVGGGLRLYVKSIVLPLLGVDVGYGIEAKDWHIYLAVGLTEL